MPTLASVIIFLLYSCPPQPSQKEDGAIKKIQKDSLNGFLRRSSTVGWLRSLISFYITQSTSPYIVSRLGFYAIIKDHACKVPDNPDTLGTIINGLGFRVIKGSN